MEEANVAMKGVRSDFLVARPSFAAGLARLFDLFGAFDVYNVSPSGVEADCKALRADWTVIGQDLEAAMKQFRADHPEVAAQGR